MEMLLQQAISPQERSRTKPASLNTRSKKTDAILAGLAIQYVKDRSTAGVVVLTDDKPARKGIENAVTAQGYTDVISVYGLADVIGDNSGDSMRLI